jgi:hypothetical protein
MEGSLKKIKVTAFLELVLEARRNKNYEAYILILKEVLKNNDKEYIYLLVNYYYYGSVNIDLETDIF